MNQFFFDPPTDFAFRCGDYVPFKDRELCEKLRQISGEGGTEFRLVHGVPAVFDDDCRIFH